jgi:hypothetical protein
MRRPSTGGRRCIPREDIMAHDAPTIAEILRRQGISRRGFLKFCATTASLMALPPSMVPAIAAALEKARRPSVIWLSFQECTGCTESLTRSHTPSIEGLILEQISLDYHHTLQAASGEAAEAAREAAMRENFGKYLLVVDGSIPLGNAGYSTIAGVSNLDMLKETAAGAAAVIAVGSCAAYGGLPAALPNPTGAVPVSAIIKDKPVMNVPGCPPIPVVITGVPGAFPHLRRAAGTRCAGPAEGVLRREHPRPLLPPPLLRPGQVRRDLRRRGCEARAGACSSSAARGRSPTTPAPPPSGTSGVSWPIEVRPRLHRLLRAGLLGHGAASTSRCRCPSRRCR